MTGIVCTTIDLAVSNLPFVSKVVEKIAAKRLIEHLNNNQLQEEFQSAYRAKHSTETLSWLLTLGSLLC